MQQDPNAFTWSQYLQDSEDNESTESEDDFRGDTLNDADWDNQGGGMVSKIPC